MILTWFEKMTTIDAYRVNGHYAPYAVLARPVRFTDAELAAEFQHSRLVSFIRQRRHHNNPTETHLFDHYDRGLKEEWTLERFATHPHFDENQPT